MSAAGRIDELEGGAGNDLFGYSHVADSTGHAYDSIVDFNAAHDAIGVGSLPTAVGTVTTGSLSQATFDNDLQGDLPFGSLPTGTAAVFTPDSGDLTGEMFLVVDSNAVAGYQAGEDLVIHLLNPGDVGTIGTSNFTLVD